MLVCFLGAVFPFHPGACIKHFLQGFKRNDACAASRAQALNQGHRQLFVCLDAALVT